MARCRECNAEFEGQRLPNCPVCGAARPRPAMKTPEPKPSPPPVPQGDQLDGTAYAPPAPHVPPQPMPPRPVPQFAQPGAVMQPMAADETMERRQRDRARKGIIQTVALSIGLGLVVLGIGRAIDTDSATIPRNLAISHVLTVLLYVAVAFLVRNRLSEDVVRPDFAEGRDATAIGIGIATGFGGGVLAVGLNSAISGRLSSDRNIVAILYERQWLWVAVVMAIAIIAAPLVEELLFRGLLVESMRERGRGGAVMAGAVAFSLWHLNPAAFRYYVLMGFLLGLLYWRFGINASITAHAVFNATLVVFAFAVIAGGPTTTTINGVTLSLPAGWIEVEEDIPDFGATFDLAVQSPTGSALVVQHVEGAASPFAGSTAPPGAANVRPVTVSGGPGLRFAMSDPSAGALQADMVMTSRATRVYIITFVSAGSSVSEANFERMLASLTLPV